MWLIQYTFYGAYRVESAASRATAHLRVLARQELAEAPPVVLLDRVEDHRTSWHVSTIKIIEVGVRVRVEERERERMGEWERY
jgi:hypothetical protein